MDLVVKFASIPGGATPRVGPASRSLFVVSVSTYEEAAAVRRSLLRYAGQHLTDVSVSTYSGGILLLTKDLRGSDPREYRKLMASLLLQTYEYLGQSWNVDMKTPAEMSNFSGQHVPRPFRISHGSSRRRA